MNRAIERATSTYLDLLIEIVLRSEKGGRRIERVNLRYVVNNICKYVNVTI
jgi:hypothetical protein